MTFYLADDADGEPTLWDGGTAVLRLHDIKAADGYRDLLWRVLTAVLAPSKDPKAFVERKIAHFIRVIALADSPPQSAAEHVSHAMVRLLEGGSES